MQRPSIGRRVGAGLMRAGSAIGGGRPMQPAMSAQPTQPQPLGDGGVPQPQQQPPQQKQKQQWWKRALGAAGAAAPYV